MPWHDNAKAMTVKPAHNHSLGLGQAKVAFIYSQKTTYENEITINEIYDYVDKNTPYRQTDPRFYTSKLNG